jgi:uncharacterized FAD-dependent dehydrogenase
MHHLWVVRPLVKRGGEKPRGSVWGGDATPLRHHPAARPRPEDLERAVCAKLGIAPEALRRVHMVRRGNDARKKSAIKLVYVLDVEVEDEARILTGFAEDQHVRATPDTSYHFPVMAPADYSGPRPVVIGAGPCGLLAALILAQMGLKPIIIERGKAVRERTKDTGACGAAANSTRNRTCSSARAGRYLLRRQALQPHQGPAPSGPQGAGGVREGRGAR